METEDLDFDSHLRNSEERFGDARDELFGEERFGDERDFEGYEEETV